MPALRHRTGEPPGARSIKLFPYPELLAYQRHGSVDKASSFVDKAYSFVGKVSKALEAPVNSPVQFNDKMIWCNRQGVSCKKRLMPTS